MGLGNTAAYVTALCCLILVAASPLEQLSDRVRQLGDADPAVRSDAERELMSLKFTDLADLRQAVEQAEPIGPEQRALLHQIVQQIVIAEEAGKTGHDGFIGASLLPCEVAGQGGESRTAVLIGQRIAGFPAYRTLHTGDIILSVDGNAQVVSNPGEFTRLVQSHAPGTTIQLSILRDGHVRTVPLRLSARPKWAESQNDLEQAIQIRQQQAEEYWQRVFGPLVVPAK